MATHRRGQIIARGPGTWLLRVSLPADVDGKRRTWNRTVHGTKKDADRALTAALRALDEGRLEDPSRMPLAAWLEEWLQSKGADLRERSLEMYRTWVRLYLAPPLGQVRLADLKPRDVQRAITELLAGKHSEGRPLSPATVRAVVARLRSALAAAVRLRLIPSNPADGAALPKRPSKSPKRVLSLEEASVFVEAVGKHRLGAFWILALGTGLRPGEALGLQWEDVDLEGGRLHVRRSLWNSRAAGRKPELTPPKTASSVRTVPLAPELVALLRRHSSAQKRERLAAGSAWRGTGFVFCREDGSPQSAGNCLRMLDRIMAAAGLERITQHGLRHSAATILVKAGIDPAHVAAQLGHSSVKTTLELYVQVGEDRLREGANLLSGAMFRPDARPGRSGTEHR